MTYGSVSCSGSCSFRQWRSRCKQQIFVFLKFFFAYYFLTVHLHYTPKIKVIKKSQNNRNPGFSYTYYFAWWWKDPDSYKKWRIQEVHKHKIPNMGRGVWLPSPPTHFYSWLWLSYLTTTSLFVLLVSYLISCLQKNTSKICIATFLKMVGTNGGLRPSLSSIFNQEMELHYIIWFVFLSSGIVR